MDEITLTITEFKALASDTRTGIIKLLGKRNYTLSEISGKMSLAAPTVKQHLSVLQSAGLIEQLDEGRKWKYYALTRKGKKIILQETPASVFIVLALSVVGMIGVIYGLLQRTALSIQTMPDSSRELVYSAVDKAEEAGNAAVPVGEVATEVGQAAGFDPTVLALAVAAIALAVLIFYSVSRIARK